MQREEGGKKMKRGGREGREVGEREREREASILTNLVVKAINYLCYYKPLFLLMQGKKIILWGWETWNINTACRCS